MTLAAWTCPGGGRLLKWLRAVTVCERRLRCVRATELVLVCGRGPSATGDGCGGGTGERNHATTLSGVTRRSFGRGEEPSKAPLVRRLSRAASAGSAAGELATRLGRADVPAASAVGRTLGGATPRRETQCIGLGLCNAGPGKRRKGAPQGLRPMWSDWKMCGIPAKGATDNRPRLETRSERSGAIPGGKGSGEPASAGELLLESSGKRAP